MPSSSGCHIDMYFCLRPVPNTFPSECPSSSSNRQCNEGHGGQSVDCLQPYFPGSRIEMSLTLQPTQAGWPLVEAWLYPNPILSPARTRLTSNQHQSWLKHIGTVDQEAAQA
jgi:hypothetical protein